jgi:uncharacterized membrane protein
MKRIPFVDLLILCGILLVWGVSMALAGNDSSSPFAPIRLVLGIICVLFSPGYVLQAAIFPKHHDLDIYLRLVFSFGLSIVPLPIIALIANAVGLGITAPTMIGGVLILFFAGTIAVVIVRSYLREERSPARLPIRVWKSWLPKNGMDRFLLGILAAAFFVAFGSAVYLYQKPPVERYTEFYLLPNRMSPEEGSSRLVANSGSLMIGLGIINREGESGTYRIIAVSDDGRGLGELGPFFLENGEQWEGEIALVVDRVGANQRISFYLERVGSPWPYRTLQMWIDILNKEEYTSTRTIPPTAYVRMAPVDIESPCGRSGDAKE